MTELNQKSKDIVDNYVSLIKKSDFESAVSLASELGSLLWLNNLGIYSLPEVEAYMIALAENSLLNEEANQGSPNNAFKDYLFVATELYLTGGHSRLMENLSTFIDESPKDLIVTNDMDKKIFAREKNYFDSVFTLGGMGLTSLEKLVKLSNLMANYTYVFLNIHPYDILAIMSCALAKKKNKSLKIYFINHADHAFTYGVSVADVWYEISLYGIAVDANRGLLSKKSFLAIPVKIDQFQPIKIKFADGDLIMTGANSLKYKPMNGMSIIPLIDALLTKYQNSVCNVIGVNKFRDYWWWILKLKHWNRLTLSSSLCIEDYLKMTQKSKLFIDSHPIPGGTAFVEQYLNSKLCAGLVSPYKGYTPLERVKMQDIDSVIDFIETIDLNKFNGLITEISMIHSHEQVKARFVKSLRNEFTSYSEISCFDAKVNLIVPSKINIIPVSLSIRNFGLFKAIISHSNPVAISWFLLKKLRLLTRMLRLK